MSTAITEKELNQKEIQALEEIKQQCIATLEYIENIQKDENVTTNLGYIVHDWNNSAHRRNDVVATSMKILENAHSRLEESEDGAN